MTRRAAADVEDLGALELGRIPIGGIEDLEDHLTASDPLATKVDVVAHQAWLARDGAFEAQRLLDRQLQQGRVGRQGRPSIPVLEEEMERVTDQ